MEKKANSIAVVTVSIIAILAAIGTAIYFVMRYLNKRDQDCYDFADCYDPDEMFDYDDCDCGCIEDEKESEEEPEATEEDAE